MFDPRPGVLPALLLLLFTTAARAGAQSSSACAGADRFLRTDRQMATLMERDTIDDWRTRQKVVGCRVTAVGLTRDGISRAASLFYERLRAAGWVRTPDPMDAPNESSLRYRRSGVDCLFNVYRDGTLMTEAESQVAAQREPKPGEERYGVLVQCMRAMPARSGS